MKKDSRTYTDRRKYSIKSVSDRRKKIRLMDVANAGGKCMRCGYNKYQEVLEFHHKDSSKKKFGIGQNGLTRSWKKVKTEIEKCNLLCANCHREIHVEEKLAKEDNIGIKNRLS